MATRKRKTGGATARYAGESALQLNPGDAPRAVPMSTPGTDYPPGRLLASSCSGGALRGVVLYAAEVCPEGGPVAVVGAVGRPAILSPGDALGVVLAVS